MINDLKTKLKESLFSILPIMIVVLIVGLILDLSPFLLISFLFCSTLLIVGMGMFNSGAAISMLVIGEKMGRGIVKSRKIWLILLVCFIVGIVITVAEPALQVLAVQTPSINRLVLVITIGIGVGVFLAIAALRTIFGFNLSRMLVILYVLVFIILFFIPGEFVPLAFDSGGVTTGPISVPFILALGIGLTTVRRDKNAKEDSFGLIALCSIGPIIAIAILGLFYGTNSSYEASTIVGFLSFKDIITTYIYSLSSYLKEVMLSLGPIVFVFVIFELFAKDVRRKDIIKIVMGLLVTLLGMTFFLTSVNVGLLPIAQSIGEVMTNSTFKYLLIPLGMLIGYISVAAEPSVHVLNEQVEEVTEGTISKKMMKFCLSIGVAIAVGLSLVRIFTELPIMYILLPGYLIAIILTFFTPPIFTAIAFDSGGAVSGPMASSFLLPLAIGACTALGGNILADAFGLVAFVAMTPLITIQIVGIIYKIKSRRKIEFVFDETIIDYDWSVN